MKIDFPFTIWIAVVGIFLIAIASLILIYFNWGSKDISYKAAGAIFVGIVTFFVSFYFSLSVENYHKVFPSYIIIDKDSFLPVWFPIEDVDQLFNIRSTELSGISSRLQTNTDLISRLPRNEEEAKKFLTILLAHKLLLDITKIGNQDYSRIENNHSVKVIMRDPTQRPVELQSFFYEDLKKMLASDYFLDNQQEKVFFDKGLKLPINSKIFFYAHESGNNSVDLILEKKHFFMVKINVEFVMASKLGVYPYGMTDRGAEFFRSGRKTYHFRITMHADFDLMSSKNPKSQEYKIWIKSLFDSLETLNTIENK